jgi:hypothetical protein
MTAAAGKFWRGSLSRGGIFLLTGVVLFLRLDDRSRMTRECHVRICGGLGGKFPGATRHPGVQPLLSARVLGQSRSHDRREVEFVRQIQQEKHQVIARQPLDRRRWHEVGQPWQPRAEGFGFDPAPFYRPDRLLSLGFGRIWERICRGMGQSMRNRLLARRSPPALLRSHRVARSGAPRWCVGMAGLVSEPRKRACPSLERATVGPAA